MKKPEVQQDEDNGTFIVWIGVVQVSPPFRTAEEANIWADGCHRGSEFILDKVREKIDAIDGRVSVRR